MNFADTVKKVLEEKIHELYGQKELYCKNPKVDFSRHSKLGFERIMKILIYMGDGTLNNELLKEFEYSPNTATSSAFIQQRHKLKEEVFIDLFNEFNNAFPFNRTYNGYRLIACDGSYMNIYRNPKDPDTYFQSKDSLGYNMVHLTACYDLCNQRYTDGIISPGRLANERASMITMLDRYTGPRETIFIADRGFESYNLYAHAIENNLKFMIRIQDCIHSRQRIFKGCAMPDSDEFDMHFSRIFTRRQTKEHKQHPEIYKILNTTSNFDYIHSQDETYNMNLRILRFAISKDAYECIVTNLPPEEFDARTIKELYNLRWGIETAFCKLKYTIGLTAFHSKRVDFIYQEIYARLILHNFCSLITSKVTLEKKTDKYTYQLNYATGVQICRHFLRLKTSDPPLKIETLLRKYILPIRPGRNDRHKAVKNQPAISFVYRAAV